MCIRKIVYLHSPHVFLSKCLSVSLPARAHGSAWRPAKRIEDGEKQKAKKKKKKVLSVSAAWAGSWWEREGRRLAGRSHALFRHHSDGARPLGQNTTWFWITRTHKLENHTHLPQLPQLFQLFHVFLRIANSISLLCDCKVEPLTFLQLIKVRERLLSFFVLHHTFYWKIQKRIDYYFEDVCMWCHPKHLCETASEKGKHAIILFLS